MHTFKDSVLRFLLVKLALDIKSGDVYSFFLSFPFLLLIAAIGIPLAIFFDFFIAAYRLFDK